HKESVRCVAFSPDGKTLASGSSDTTIRLWDAATGEHKRTLNGHTANVDIVTFSPDGKTLATGSQDGTALIWDFASIVDSVDTQN
ncbi:WD40 repeat domain-containing protein, partial [Candidatus Poribacteria bacterium]|nr:WD40 repeat domain-containing protein [Candidatus Poribacteria bacterium]